MRLLPDIVGLLVTPVNIILSTVPLAFILKPWLAAVNELASQYALSELVGTEAPAAPPLAEPHEKVLDQVPTEA